MLLERNEVLKDDQERNPAKEYDTQYSSHKPVNQNEIFCGTFVVEHLGCFPDNAAKGEQDHDVTQRIELVHQDQGNGGWQVCRIPLLQED